MSQTLQSSEHDKFFGVDSLLKLNAKIVFETLFSLRHCGRVMDLLLHASREFIKNCDEKDAMESRIRHCLELAILSAWVNYRADESTKTLEIELGWDDEKLVISIAGFVSDDVSNVVGVAEQGVSAATENLIRYLVAIEENSTGIVVRHQQSIGHLQTFIIIAARADAPKQSSQYIAVTNPSIDAPGSPGSNGQVQVVNLPKSPLSKKSRLDRFMAEEKNEDDAREKVQQKRLQGKPGPVTKKAKDALAEIHGQPVEVDDDPVVVQGTIDEDSDDAIAVSEDSFDATDETDTDLSEDSVEEDSETTVESIEEEIAVLTEVRGSADSPETKAKVKALHEKAVALAKVKNTKEKAAAIAKVKAVKEKAEAVAKVKAMKEKAEAVAKVKGAKEKAAALAKVKGSKDDIDAATKVDGTPDAEDESTMVKGYYAESDETGATVDGFDDSADDTAILVEGSDEEITEDQTTISDTNQKLVNGKTVVGGSKKPLTNEAKARLKAGQKQSSKQVVTKIAGTESDDNTDGTIVTVSGPDDPLENTEEFLVSGEEYETEDDTKIEVAEPKKVKKVELIRKIKQKKKVSTQDEELLTLIENSDENQSEEDLTLLVEEEDSAKQILIDEKKTINLIQALEANILSTEVSTNEFEAMVGVSSQNFEKTIVKYKQVIDRVQIPEKVKQYLSTMFEEISRDRADFEAKAREVNSKWKKAQLEFKTQQGALESEIKKRDTQIRQKTVSLDKAKQMLTGAMKSLESAKSSNQAANASDNAQRELRMKAIKEKAREQVEKAVIRLEEAQKKLSMEVAQRTNMTLQNSKLSKHIEEIQKKFYDAEKSRQVVKEDPAIKAEKERSQRQVEELKKQNRQLQEKLTQLVMVKQGAGASNKSNKENQGGESSDVEVKHKLEQSQKLYHKIKDDYDKTVKRLDEAKQGETKLRVEISKLQAELKTASKNNAKK